MGTRESVGVCGYVGVGVVECGRRRECGRVRVGVVECGRRIECEDVCECVRL